MGQDRPRQHRAVLEPEQRRQQTRSALSVRFADGITEVLVPATDLESAVVWYVTHLGCDVVAYQPRQALLRVPGGPRLVLWASTMAAQPPMMANGVPCAALRLQTRDMAALSAYLQAAQSEMQQQSDQTTGRGILRLCDPSGNLLLIQEEPAADLRSVAPITPPAHLASEPMPRSLPGLRA